MIYEDWKPTRRGHCLPAGAGRARRQQSAQRIYFFGVTPDLYRPKYGDKVVAFFDRLLDPQYAGKPFMRHYLDYYLDIYWDLHLGVKGDRGPAEGPQIGEAFNTVLAYRDPRKRSSTKTT